MRITDTYLPDQYTESIVPQYRIYDYLHLGTVKNLHIWTLSGNKDFKNISQLYFTNVDFLLLCFSLDDPQSLEDITYWNDLFENHKTPTDKSTIKYLIAMKADTYHSEKES